MKEIARLVAENPREAKKVIRGVFEQGGFDYFTAAKLLDCHHYTLRKAARALGITRDLVKAREKAIASGKRKRDTGRPRKDVPSEDTLIKAFLRSGSTLSATAKALNVSAPTLRAWITQLKLSKKLQKLSAWSRHRARVC